MPPLTAQAAAAFSKGAVPGTAVVAGVAPPTASHAAPPTASHADTAAAFATAAAIAAGAEGMGAEMAAWRALFTQHMQCALARGS